VKIARWPLLAVVALLLAGCGSSHPVSNGQPRTPAYLNCVGDGQMRIRPRTIMDACGTGAFYVSRIRWSSWTPRSATGTGVAHQNTCMPACPAGNFVTYRIAIHLTQPRTCTRHRLLFTRMEAQEIYRRSDIPRRAFGYRATCPRA
jgi:hypothetical protein